LVKASFALQTRKKKTEILAGYVHVLCVQLSTIHQNMQSFLAVTVFQCVRTFPTYKNTMQTLLAFMIPWKRLVDINAKREQWIKGVCFPFWSVRSWQLTTTLTSKQGHFCFLRSKRKSSGIKNSRIYSCSLVKSSSKAVFLKLFYSIAPFSLSTHRFRLPNLTKQPQGSEFKEFCLRKY